jgi:hypothetical protein
LNIKNVKTGIVDEVFKAEPRPSNTIRQYGFGYYTININYIDDEMKKYLPPSDCRRRMDQRWMEEGKYDEAAEEKQRLE